MYFCDLSEVHRKWESRVRTMDLRNLYFQKRKYFAEKCIRKYFLYTDTEQIERDLYFCHLSGFVIEKQAVFLITELFILIFMLL